MNIFRLLRDKYESQRRRLEKRRYTPETYPGYLRKCGAQVGDGCRIASMDMDTGIEAYLLKIGNHVEIAAGAVCLTHDGAAWIFRHLVPTLQVYGAVTIDDDCSIGRGAILCPGVHIGRNSVVAPGSVVIADVPPDTLVWGVPARSSGPSHKLHAGGLASAGEVKS